MGIASGTKMGTRVVSGLFTPILERGTVIPASREEPFYTLEDGQRELLIEVYQGEHSLCRDNAKLGQLMIRGLPRGRAGEVWVNVRFTYDMNGILEVEAKVMDTGRVEHLVIESRPGKLSPKQIEEARAAMKRIKFHPRDNLPNRTALARADALFAETTGLERELLGQALGAFRAALELQDSAIIEPARERLNALIEDLRRR
jgi:molecular chaperone HscC